MNLNGLEKYFETVNGEIVDFTQGNRGNNPLIYALLNNKTKNFNLNNEQWEYLIKNSNLNQPEEKYLSPLILVFCLNKLQKLNLSENNLNYLIKNSDLKKMDMFYEIPLNHALINNKLGNLNLNKKQWKYLIENSDLSLIEGKESLIELKKIQSELINDNILNKIDIKEEINNKKSKKI